MQKALAILSVVFVWLKQVLEFLGWIMDIVGLQEYSSRISGLLQKPDGTPDYLGYIFWLGVVVLLVTIAFEIKKYLAGGRQDETDIDRQGKKIETEDTSLIPTPRLAGEYPVTIEIVKSYTTKSHHSFLEYRCVSVVLNGGITISGPAANDDTDDRFAAFINRMRNTSSTSLVYEISVKNHGKHTIYNPCIIVTIERYESLKDENDSRVLKPGDLISRTTHDISLNDNLEHGKPIRLLFSNRSDCIVNIVFSNEITGDTHQYGSIKIPCIITGKLGNFCIMPPIIDVE